MRGEVLKKQDFFKQFLSEIADSVSPGTYSVWFNDLELISMDDKEIVIKVPLQAHKQILRTNYMKLIDDITFAILGSNYEYKFYTEDDLNELKLKCNKNSV